MTESFKECLHAAALFEKDYGAMKKSICRILLALSK